VDRIGVTKHSGSIVVGVDEAGRGPLIGPMVVASVAIEENLIEELSKIGVRDSKRLSRSARERLFEKILTISRVSLVITFSPRDLDARNINTLELEAIEKILDAFVKILGGCPRIYIDLFTSQKRISGLRSICPDIVAEHRADSRYAVVSAASIVAKVLRDWHVDSIRKALGDFGSGYPSDPRTREWILRTGGEELEMARMFIRHKWSTLERLRVNANILDRYIKSG
jgi:ribonuclease HII